MHQVLLYSFCHTSDMHSYTLIHERQILERSYHQDDPLLAKEYGEQRDS